MPAAEAFDVVVVRDPTMTVGAIMKLARDLAHLTRVKQADVEVALQKGRFVVYPGLASEKVEAAADELRRMGAVVQLKPTQPAAPAQGLRAGGFGGPVADFGELNLDSGAFNTGSGLLAPTGFDDGIGRVLPSEDALTNRYPQVQRATSSQRSLSDEDMRDLVTGLEPSPVALDASEPPDQLEALALGLDAAALDSPSVQTIDGMDGAAFDAAEEAAKKEAAGLAPLEAQTTSNEDAELALDAAEPHPPGSASTGRGPGPEASLQLDRAQSSDSLPSAPLPPPRMTDAAYSSGTAPIPPRASMSIPDMSVPGDRGLLLEDPIANTLALIAACCLVSLVLAAGITRATKRAEVTTLEDEIAQSYRNPYEVERGDMRAPAEIETELEEIYGSSRLQFLVVLVLGVPIGLGLGRIRR